MNYPTKTPSERKGNATREVTSVARKPTAPPPRVAAPTPETPSLMTFQRFSVANRERCESPHGFNHRLDAWSTSDWFVAVIGELGEAANVVKKLNRVRDGVPGNKETPDALRDKLRQELGDAFVYLDLIAQSLGFLIAEAAVEVFDKKSIEIGYPDPPLAGAVSHPQPDPRPTNDDDKTEESDGSVENAMANGETRGMDGGGLDGPAPDDRRVPAADDYPAHTRPTGTYNCPVCGWNVPHREHAGAIIERQVFELTRWREWWRHVDLMIRSGIRPGCGTSVATRNCDDLLAGRGANMLAPFDR